MPDHLVEFNNIPTSSKNLRQTYTAQKSLGKLWVTEHSLWHNVIYIVPYSFSILTRIQVAIPYQSLEPVSGVIKQSIVTALHQSANSQSDPRKVSACLELGICYSSGFGIATLDSSRKPKALYWMIEAAKLGNVFARASIIPLSEALGQRIPEEIPVKQWLAESAAEGSVLALDTLKSIDHEAYLRTLAATRVCDALAFLNDPAARKDILPPEHLGEMQSDIHSIASNGQLHTPVTPKDDVKNTINTQCHNGDTPLICAARSGNLEILRRLCSMGANGTIHNANFENGLHFLAAFNSNFVPEAARLLVDAGASLHLSSKNFGGRDITGIRPLGNGTPALRAVQLGRHEALTALLELEQSTASELSGSNIRSLFSHAILLHDPKSIEILYWFYRHTPAFEQLRTARWWRNGRLRNLVEICVLGPVSANSNCGIDLPDRFWRCVTYGANHFRCLQRTFEFLEFIGFKLNEHPCDSLRNVFFFAIREGRRDAVRWLAKYPCGRHQYNRRIFGPNPRGLNLGKAPPLLSACSPNPEQGERSEQSVDVSETEEQHMFYEGLYSTDDQEPDVHQQDGSRNSNPRSVDDAIEEREDLANHTAKHGLVNAVICAIRCGHRGILEDLLLNWNGYALSTGHPRVVYVTPKPCTVRKIREIEERRYDIPASYTQRHDVGQYFPRVQEHFHLSDVPPPPEDYYFKADGSLHYSLLFLSAIARSVHRDIYLLYVINRWKSASY